MELLKWMLKLTGFRIFQFLKWHIAFSLVLSNFCNIWQIVNFINFFIGNFCFLSILWWKMVHSEPWLYINLTWTEQRLVLRCVYGAFNDSTVWTRTNLSIHANLDILWLKVTRDIHLKPCRTQMLYHFSAMIIRQHHTNEFFHENSIKRD